MLIMAEKYYAQFWPANKQMPSFKIVNINYRWPFLPTFSLNVCEFGFSKPTQMCEIEKIISSAICI